MRPLAAGLTARYREEEGVESAPSLPWIHSRGAAERAAVVGAAVDENYEIWNLGRPTPGDKWGLVNS